MALTQNENITTDSSVYILNTLITEFVIQPSKQTISERDLGRDIPQDISELIAKRNKLLKIKKDIDSSKIF